MLDYFKHAAWELAFNLSEMARLGRRGWYWRLHWALHRAYRGDGVRWVLDREAKATGLSRDQLTYGETPALSMLAILARAGVSPQDVLFDLGCGRGLALLAASLEWPLEAVGIDAIPTFVTRGNAMCQRLGVAERVRFINSNFLDCDLSRGTLFYAAATTFERDIVDDVAARVAEHAATAKHPVRFVTLSQTLLPPWKLVAKGSYPMTWGWNSVYFHSLDSSESRSSSNA